MNKKTVLDIENIQLNHDIDTRQKIFKFYNNYETCRAIKRCMLEDETDKCSGKIIKAHSVSKKNGLSRISSFNKRGIEVVGRFKKGNTTTLSPFEQNYIEQYIPVESASIFTGLCKKHDNDLFKVIDESENIVINDKTVYEYVLRCSIYYWYERMSNRICADKRRRKFSHKIFDKLFFDIMDTENALEREVNYLISNIENVKNKLHYKTYEIDGNLNIAGNFYEHDGSTIMYTILIPDAYKSYVLMACTKNNNFLEVDKNFRFFNLKDKEEFQLALTELLLHSTTIKHYFFNHNKWNSISKEKQESVLEWIYLDDIDKSTNVNTRDKIMKMPNFVKYMID
ncbi:hypothetical protein JNO63_06215 [Anaerococcus sp. mt242]|uniref:hypothetical protein n=1 Tax=Anaerococcus sp. mt242 TaxID=2661917 RepID=UPI001934524F|nr:hypothetical protein [Anaerococcus sp. mt242]MBM0046682.1 hypothetical protein [Anaerococcus sp. mt242]